MNRPCISRIAYLYQYHVSIFGWLLTNYITKRSKDVTICCTVELRQSMTTRHEDRTRLTLKNCAVIDIL
jgi:hypothetical protein